MIIVNGYELALLGVNYIDSNTNIEYEISDRHCEKSEYLKFIPEIPLGKWRTPVITNSRGLHLKVMSN